MNTINIDVTKLERSLIALIKEKYQNKNDKLDMILLFSIILSFKQ